MKATHEAASYDKWFREQVDQAQIEADDPNTQWIPHEVVKAEVAAQRKLLQARIAAAAK